MSFCEDEPKRILIVGLPGAGLRTIKAVVVDNQPPQNLKSMVEKLEIGNKMRDVLQQRVLLIKCGGDQALQDVLGIDKEPIYQHVQALIFVIDVNEQSNFSIAKYWFDALVKHLHKFSPDARIFLFLHKMDLLSKKENIPEYIRAAKNLFTSQNLDVYTHETSIFDQTIYMAFRDVLMKEVDDQISVKQYLNRALEESSFVGMGVYSEEGLVIYQAGELPSVVEMTANVMLSSIQRIKRELEPDDDVITTLLEMKKNTFIVFKTINNSNFFVGMSIIRPKLGQLLLETEQITEKLQKALSEDSF